MRACLSVHFFPVPDFEDGYFPATVIDQVDDPKPALAYTVAIRISGELLACLRAGVLGQRLNPRNDALAIVLGINRFNLFCGRGLDQ
jgi:hypothetical protein